MGVEEGEVGWWGRGGVSGATGRGAPGGAGSIGLVSGAPTGERRVVVAVAGVVRGVPGLVCVGALGSGAPRPGRGGRGVGPGAGVEPVGVVVAPVAVEC
ncbi:predicted protein [Streptomyces viridochromogenes DSM 40736]|uniref:Predicted protein n=1 Tax=Streptomyces viridochromogenes (strain DSM 40736 / JCM 4977 / BCRC 1201 / Tue 494) TaxID=591159 RepID=D9XJ65_STRVT|nr:hypothetical protein [Streptomyces viridochromogenes]EFL35180.1 predicted protein [Streptomyces viridochromogenes DSM 40736]